MGFEKFRRPLITQGINVLSSGAAGTPNAVIGDVRVGGAGGIVEVVQAITSTATIANGYGVTTIAPGTGDLTFRLAAPIQAGIHKTVVFDHRAASTQDVALRTASTAHTFWGTTMQTFSLSTASDGANVVSALSFVAQSTTAWAVVGRSTGWVLT